jgi:predicted alpha/beta superfamily hydrolase
MSGRIRELWFTADSPMEEIPPVDIHLIESKHVDQTYKIEVLQPARPVGRPPEPVPVVYATDGNWTFEIFKALSYLMQLGQADVPNFILVGISYASDFPHAGMYLRIRDYTAPPYPYWDPGGIKPIFDESVRPAGKDFHGGDDFRTFIAEEVIPLVDENYPTIPEDRTYFGHSGGGYFGLYTLWTQPELFRNYIVSSPGLVYHGFMPDGHWTEHNHFGLKLVEDIITLDDALDGKRLYLSAGGEEEFEPALGGWQLTSGLLRASKLFRQARVPGLEVMTEIFPNETHMTAWPIAFMHGVQACLGTRRVRDPVYF